MDLEMKARYSGWLARKVIIGVHFEQTRGRGCCRSSWKPRRIRLCLGGRQIRSGLIRF